MNSPYLKQISLIITVCLLVQTPLQAFNWRQVNWWHIGAAVATLAVCTAVYMGFRQNNVQSPAKTPKGTPKPDNATSQPNRTPSASLTPCRQVNDNNIAPLADKELDANASQVSDTDTEQEDNEPIGPNQMISLESTEGSAFFPGVAQKVRQIYRLPSAHKIELPPLAFALAFPEASSGDLLELIGKGASTTPQLDKVQQTALFVHAQPQHDAENFLTTFENTTVENFRPRPLAWFALLMHKKAHEEGDEDNFDARRARSIEILKRLPVAEQDELNVFLCRFGGRKTVGTIGRHIHNDLTGMFEEAQAQASQN